MQPHMRVRIHVLDAAPLFRAVDGQAQFFHELALQRFQDRLARIDFTAREFPVPVIRLAGRTLAQQHIAVRLDQDADCHINGLAHASFPA
jgi:hypothetical protein